MKERLVIKFKGEPHWIDYKDYVTAMYWKEWNEEVAIHNMYHGCKLISKENGVAKFECGKVYRLKQYIHTGGIPIKGVGSK